MDVITFAELIVEVGLPLAEKLLAAIESKSEVTSAKWAALKLDTQQSASDRMKANVIALGLSLDDPKIVQLINMAQ